MIYHVETVASIIHKQSHFEAFVIGGSWKVGRAIKSLPEGR